MQQDNDVKAVMPLDQLARQIEEQSGKADQHVLKAAALVAEARERVEEGEAGPIKWMAWARKHINLSDSRLYELNAIAEAEDPVKELERIRKLTRERVKRHREREAAKQADEKAQAQKSSLEPARKQLIAWTKTAPLEEVERVLDQVAGRDKAAGSANQLPAAERQHAA